MAWHGMAWHDGGVRGSMMQVSVSVWRLWPAQVKSYCVVCMYSSLVYLIGNIRRNEVNGFDVRCSLGISIHTV